MWNDTSHRSTEHQQIIPRRAVKPILNTRYRSHLGVSPPLHKLNNLILYATGLHSEQREAERQSCFLWFLLPVSIALRDPLPFLLLRSVAKNNSVPFQGRHSGYRRCGQENQGERTRTHNGQSHRTAASASKREEWRMGDPPAGLPLWSKSNEGHPEAPQLVLQCLQFKSHLTCLLYFLHICLNAI